MNKHRSAIFGFLLMFFLFTGVMLVISGCGSCVDKAAHEKFYRDHEPVSLTIYPVNIVIGSMTLQDKYLSDRIAYFLSDELLANPIVSTRKFVYSCMWWQSKSSRENNVAKSFAAKVKSDKISSKYALLVEMNSNSTEKLIFSVQYTLVTADGFVVENYVYDQSNALYKELNPLNRQDGVKLAMRAIKEKWVTRP